MSRAFVELLGDGVEVGLGEGAEAGPAGQVLAQQAVDVFSLLPRCQGDLGSQKQACTPVWMVNRW